MNKICITVAAGNSKILTEKIAQLSYEHDFFELRLDLLEDLSVETVKKTLSNLKTDVIATLRTVSEGGRFSGSDENYFQFIELLFSSKAKFIDVELSQLKKIASLKECLQPSRTIISYHNFTGTPSESELGQTVRDMTGFSEKSKYKIACTVNNSQDLKRLMWLQKTFPSSQAVIIGMGEKGRASRIGALKLGAFTSFASSEITPVAPGQLYYKDMIKLLKEAGPNGG